jgi:phosphoribosylaminoimidazole (AIR) synthetase
MGLGMLVVVAASEAERTMDLLRANGAQPSLVGEVVAGDKGVEFV